jgi:hypothetical protein
MPRGEVGAVAETSRLLLLPSMSTVRPVSVRSPGTKLAIDVVVLAGIVAATVAGLLPKGQRAMVTCTAWCDELVTSAKSNPWPLTSLNTHECQLGTAGESESVDPVPDVSVVTTGRVARITKEAAPAAGITLFGVATYEAVL